MQRPYPANKCCSRAPGVKAVEIRNAFFAFAVSLSLFGEADELSARTRKPGTYRFIMLQNLLVRGPHRGQPLLRYSKLQKAHRRSSAFENATNEMSTWHQLYLSSVCIYLPASVQIYNPYHSVFRTWHLTYNSSYRAKAQISYIVRSNCFYLLHSLGYVSRTDIYCSLALCVDT